MVAAPRTSLQAVGEEESSKRRQILDGARKVFLELGFDGASMGEIARAAAVSKGTLYVYFPDKAGLFAAIVEEEKLEQGKVSFNFDPARDVDTTLPEFGRAYIALLCRPGGGSAIRTVMADAGHRSRKLTRTLKRHEGWRLLIVERRERAFKITGLTWIVERSFAWLGRKRRFSKDYEYKVQTSETLIDLAATRLMLNRIVAGQGFSDTLSGKAEPAAYIS